MDRGLGYPQAMRDCDWRGAQGWLHIQSFVPVAGGGSSEGQCY